MSLNLLVHSISFAKCGRDPTYVPGNVSIEWLVTHPNAFLWADNIFMSNESFENIPYHYKERVRQESIQLVLDEFKKRKIIQTFNPFSLAKPPLDDLIWNQVDEDQKRWGIKDCVVDADGKRDHCTVDMHGIRVCPTILGSIYFTLAFCRILDAGCLLDQQFIDICNNRFSEIEPKNTEQFLNVFDMLVPSVQVLGDYVFSEWREQNRTEGTPSEKRLCNDCINSEKCKSECLDQTESLIGKIIDFRKRDEMAETKKTIIKTIASVKKQGSEDTNDILKELGEEARKCRERMLASFPKVQRWIRISTILSLPIPLLGTYYNNSIISMTGMTALTIAKLAEKSLDHMKDKYRWVNFLDEMKQL